MAKILDFREDNFQTTEFTGKLLSQEVRTVGKSEKEAWVWSFDIEGRDDSLDLVLWDVVPKKFPDGTERYNNKRNVGRMIQSILSWGISIDGEGKTFKFSPDLVGKTITLTPCDQREYTKDDEKKLGFNWEITAIQGMNKKGATGATPPAKETAPAPKVDASSMTEKWKDFLAENLTTPTNEAGIIKLVNSRIPDATARKPYSETRKAALTALVTEGFLNNDEGKFSVA